MVTHVFTIQPTILSGTVVTIEADLSRGLYSFSIVGLAGQATLESRDRVSSAIKHTGLAAPKSQNQKIVISLSPADIKKEGPLFDVPIAIAYLLAAGMVTTDNTQRIYVGELALNGTLRPIKGVLSIVKKAKEAGFTEVIVPQANAVEAALIEDITIFAADNLHAVLMHIDTTHPDHQPLKPQPLTSITQSWHDALIRLEDIKGQESAKRALIIAAAGKHNVILVGPPGTGKTMLARAFQGILPPLVRSEALEVNAIHSLAGDPTQQLSATPPFRTPHHTASYTALVGGGTHPKPGEVTLAHHGVLFMDEFPEFDRRALDALRQPLEDKVVSIARVQGTALFPADFILVAAMNPYRGSYDGTTDLARAMKETYHGKISGPILDRIDLWIEVPHVDYETLTQLHRNDEETNQARVLITAARGIQNTRLLDRGITVNASMTSRDLDDIIVLTPAVKDLLKVSAAKLKLSPRSYYRLIRVAQTIADLEAADSIEEKHVFEALQYRVKL